MFIEAADSGGATRPRATSRSANPDAGAEGGFSLVEMMVSIVLTGVVGAAIVGVLMEQNGFYQENSRRVMGQKSLRRTADLMSTEIRMIHQGDVQTAEADRVTARHGLTAGVVCHTTSTTAFVYLHRLSDSEPETVRYLEPRFDGSWQTGLVWSDLQVDGSETCASYGAPSGKSSERYREVTSWPGSMPEVGSLVYGTSPLTYEFVEQGDGDIVLLRNDERFAGPFEESGTYFRYFRPDGTELSAPVGGSSLDQISTVRIDATALGHDPNPRYRGERTISLRVLFRN